MTISVEFLISDWHHGIKSRRYRYMHYVRHACQCVPSDVYKCTQFITMLLFFSLLEVLVVALLEPKLVVCKQYFSKSC